MDQSKITILVVDDERPVLEMLRDYFKSLGFSVKTAANGESALQILNESDGIDLVVTDIDMPGMSGIDLLRNIRAILPEMPVIIITGKQALDFAISAVKHGANDYITKPFELADIRKVVEKTLRYRISSQQRHRIFEHTKSMSINFDVRTRDIDAGIYSEYLATFLHNSNFCNKDEFHLLRGAFVETLINAIEHGNLELKSILKGNDFESIRQFEELREARLKDPQYADRYIRIAFKYNENTFSLTISDEGPGFDWKKHMKSVNQIIEEAWGRGFVMIKHIIDEVYFNEAGNSITLVKSRPKR